MCHSFTSWDKSVQISMCAFKDVSSYSSSLIKIIIMIIISSSVMIRDKQPFKLPFIPVHHLLFLTRSPLN